MREILFRGKRKDNGEWIEGFPVRIYDYGGLVWDMHPFNTNFEVTCSVVPKSIGQFIGLTDKNGKKIFEGDILQSWSDYHQNYYNQGVVRYGEFNCSCCDGVYGWYLDGGDIRNIDDYEVRGNIHDNPELLEEE